MGRGRACRTTSASFPTSCRSRHCATCRWFLRRRCRCPRTPAADLPSRSSRLPRGSRKPRTRCGPPRAATRAARLPRFTFHIPAPTELSGLRAFVTLATAAAVVGFMVGTLFLSEVERPEHSAAAAERFAPRQPLAAAGLVSPSTAPRPTVEPGSRSLTGASAPLAAASTGRRDANARKASARSDKAVATSGSGLASTRSTTKARTTPAAPRSASTKRVVVRCRDRHGRREGLGHCRAAWGEGDALRDVGPAGS